MNDTHHQMQKYITNDGYISPEKSIDATTNEIETTTTNDFKKTSKRDFIVETSIVDSTPVLKYVELHYYSRRRYLGSIPYHSMQMGKFNSNKVSELDCLPFPYSYYKKIIPRPFLPPFTTNEINCLLTIEISFEDILSILTKNNTRYNNCEIWGCDIYTDDSDITLVLVHCGVLSVDENEYNTSNRRTPGNLNNPDCVKNLIKEGVDVEFDMKVDILLLPPLQSYQSIKRFGVFSREWLQLHDGLSYGIYSVKIIPRYLNIKQAPVTHTIQSNN